MTSIAVATAQQSQGIVSRSSANKTTEKLSRTPLKVVVSKRASAIDIEAIRSHSTRLWKVPFAVEEVELLGKESIENADVVFATPSELNYLNRSGLVTIGSEHINPSLVRSLGDAAWSRTICTNTVAAHNTNTQIPDTFEASLQSKRFTDALTQHTVVKMNNKLFDSVGLKLSNDSRPSSPCELVAEGKRVAAVSYGVDAVTQKARGAPILIKPDANEMQFVPAIVKGTLRETDSAALITEWSSSPELW